MVEVVARSNKSENKPKKTFKFKLYQSKKNKKLHKLINLSCSIYNHCIALHKRYYRLYKKHLNINQLQKHITKIKSRTKKHWFILPSQSIQQITERIENSYKRFYDYIKAKNKGLKPASVSPPSFKKYKKYKSFILKQSACKIADDNTVIINKCKYKYFSSRPIDGKINTIAVKRDAIGDIYICVTTELDNLNSKSPMTGKSAGFDFGLKQFLTASDDTIKVDDLIMPQTFLANIKQLKKEQQQLSRKIKGSNNRNRARLSVARRYKKISNQRNYNHHQIANHLIKSYDVMHFETLNIRAMQMMWGRKISDYGFSDFMKILESKAKERSKTVNYIDRWYPSSKTCSNCLEINKELSLRDRNWTCNSCDVHHDRDKNASINIHRVGASTLSLRNVRPELNQAISA